jgi:pimeloyl-ACP methyl ester carboxylesterase
MNFNQDQHELHYQQIVPATVRINDACLIFLHDALGSIAQWKQFPLNLCTRLGMKGLVYERAGYTSTGPPPEKRTADYLHDYAYTELTDFIEERVPADQNMILVGHSDGGTIAMLYAHQFPDRIAGIITLAAHVINEAETIAGVLKTVSAFEAGKLNGLAKYHGDNTRAIFYAWADIWRSSAFSDWNICEEVGGTTPALLIQGEDDQFGTIKQLELLESVFENGTSQLLPNCGHHPYLDQETKLLEIIESWMSDILR